MLEITFRDTGKSAFETGLEATRHDGVVGSCFRQNAQMNVEHADVDRNWDDRENNCPNQSVYCQELISHGAIRKHLPEVTHEDVDTEE